jgi:hypothetical protein
MTNAWAAGVVTKNALAGCVIKAGRVFTHKQTCRPAKDWSDKGQWQEFTVLSGFYGLGSEQIQPSVPSGEITNTGFPCLRAKRTVDHVPECLCSLASLGAAISMSVSRTMSLQRLR